MDMTSKLHSHLSFVTLPIVSLALCGGIGWAFMFINRSWDSYYKKNPACFQHFQIAGKFNIPQPSNALAAQFLTFPVNFVRIISPFGRNIQNQLL
jgi:hypothetical protein